ncbi:hypothetical protein [Pelagicoccus albus]|uniref:Uncharacterized protein n=1 Tax=Pelagicoccus albus TaxID=415222 RepID=A0A7X1B4W1_9BACT|nr:hypothetical protein [Pelagicoccus albus]MBC2605693.1 hypothetical protein [Pelagicoccus albus]
MLSELAELPMTPSAVTGSIAGHIAKIEEALKREPWLPLNLRGLLAGELPQLRSIAEREGHAWRNQIARQVVALALASWILGPSPLESETVALLLALDLELSTASAA